MAVETEVKIRLDSAERGRALLSACGLTQSGEREFEWNRVYDTPDQRLRGSGQLIRIRKAGGRQILTYKGKPDASIHKTREELEISVSDADLLAEILQRLGYAAGFVYEKYRTEYQATGEAGHVLLDETPIGTFLELEGDAEWIDHMAIRLGFSKQDYVTSSYGRLYAAFCEENGVPLADMAFSGS